MDQVLGLWTVHTEFESCRGFCCYLSPNCNFFLICYLYSLFIILSFIIKKLPVNFGDFSKGWYFTLMSISIQIHSDPFQQCFITREDRMSVLVFPTIFYYIIHFQILNALHKQCIHVRGFNRFAENQYSHNSERKYSI